MGSRSACQCASILLALLLGSAQLAMSAESFEFVTSYDGGFVSLSADKGWVGTTYRDDYIIACTAEATALLDLRLSSRTLSARAILQNSWAAKKVALRDATTTDDPIPPPFSCAISPDDRFLYTNGKAGQGFPSQYSRDRMTGKLAIVSLDEEQVRAGSGLPRSTHLAMTPDGGSLYATSWNTLYAFERNLATGKLKLLQIVEDDTKGTSVPGEEVIRYHKIPGADVSEKLRGPEDCLVSPDGRFVYALCYQEMAISVFARDPKTHRLTCVQALWDELTMGKWKQPHLGLMFAKKISQSPDGKNLYVATIGGTVVAFGRDAASGRISHLQTIQNNPVDPEKSPNWIPALVYCVDVCVSPDGRQVYVACQEKGAIVVFERDSKAEGKLKLLTTLDEKSFPDARLRGVTKLCTTRDGKHLLALSSEALVIVFRRTDLK